MCKLFNKNEPKEWTKYGVKMSMTWNSENRMTESVSQNIYSGAKTLTRYKYDHEGNRVVKSSNYGEVVTPTPEISYRNDSIVTKHIFVSGVRVASKVSDEKSSNTYYQSVDHLGSTNILTDAKGEFYEHIETFPDGSIWVKEYVDQSEVNAVFTCHSQDMETKFYYAQARYYDAQLSSFISSDDRIDGLFTHKGLNLYSYCHHNPVMFADPDGHNKLDPDGDVGARPSSLGNSGWRVYPYGQPVSAVGSNSSTSESSSGQSSSGSGTQSNTTSSSGSSSNITAAVPTIPPANTQSVSNTTTAAANSGPTPLSVSYWRSRIRGFVNENPNVLLCNMYIGLWLSQKNIYVPHLNANGMVNYFRNSTLWRTLPRLSNRKLDHASAQQHANNGSTVVVGYDTGNNRSGHVELILSGSLSEHPSGSFGARIPERSQGHLRRSVRVEPLNRHFRGSTEPQMDYFIYIGGE